MFGLGMSEIAIILVIVLLIFGPKRIPELARAIGESLFSFRKGIKEAEDEFKKVEKEIKS